MLNYLRSQKKNITIILISGNLNHENFIWNELGEITRNM